MNEAILQLESGVAEPSAEASGDTWPATVNDLPAFYYWRQSIRDGRYIHPRRKWELSVDADRRQRWEAAFVQMREAGIAIPIVADHSAEARQTLGYVVDIRQQGPWLEELHQYLGESARDIALRNKVSVGIDPDYIDSAGNHYGEAICHSAIVAQPIVGGQGDALAASHDTGETLLLAIAIESADSSEQEYQLGRGDVAVDTDAELKRSAERESEMLDALLRDGCITPATRDAMRKVLLLDAGGRPNILTLSRDGDATMCLSRQVIDALRHNRAVDLSERTGLQTLARLIPGAEEDGIARQYGNQRAGRLNATAAL